MRTLIRQQVIRLVDRIEEDAIGNLTAWKEGKSERVVMLDAHTDEVGILISHVDEKGFLRFAPLGGWDVRLFPGARIKLLGKGGFVYGTIGFAPPHLTKLEEHSKAIPAENLAIDVGVSSKQEAFDLGIQPGTPGLLDGDFIELPNGRLLGKAFDDRAGCMVAIAVLQQLKGKKLPFTLAVNFATSEELGLRGAKVAAFRIEPTIALVLESTTAGDFPGVAEYQSPCKLGAGVAITVADRTMVTSPRMLRFLQETAQKHNVPYQLKQPLFGGTNAGEIHLSRSGVLTGVLAAPARYIHGPSTIIDQKDLESQIALTLAALEEIPGKLF
ncbi:MAG: M20/M25/M40 family metallo-hydrolase [bacterium]|nr:M20/M25/M40 family metallo-hydrolase [bacterium]